MVDLSRVLGDVYAHSDEAAALPAPVASLPSPPEPRVEPVEAPDGWDDDARLDAAFRRWRAGSQVEPSAAERGLAAPARQQEAGVGRTLTLDPVAAAGAPEASWPGTPPEQDSLAASYVPGTPAAAFEDGGLSPQAAGVLEAEALGQADSAGRTEAVDPAGASPSTDDLTDTVAVAAAEAVAAEMSGRPRWSREQDDILPASKGRRGRLRLRLR